MEELIELLCRPWAILPERLSEVTASLVSAINGREVFAAGPLKQQSKQKAKNVAVIPVQGVITPRLSWWGTSIRDIRSQFRDALADDSVASILFEFDSPGGSVFGVDELSREIYQARGIKPIVAIADSMSASAAYYLASAADEVYVTPTGQVGSIGVYAAHRDLSKALDQDGVKVTMISAGKYKTEGNPYEPLSDEARASIQKTVDQYYEMFVNSVARNRTRSIDEVVNGFGQGRVLGSVDAYNEGLVNGIKTFDEVLVSMLQSIQKPQSSVCQVRIPGPPPEPMIADAGGMSEDARSHREGLRRNAEEIEAHHGNRNRKEREEMKPSQLLRQKRAQLVKDFSAIQEAAEGNLNEEDRTKLASINAQISVLDKDIADAEANEARMAALDRPVQSAPARVHDRAEDKPWASFSEFLSAVIAAGNPTAPVLDPRFKPQAAASGMSNYPTDGGFLVAPQFSSELLKRSYETGALISRCRRIPISGNTISIPYVSESSRASTQYGGVLGYWLAEADSITASKPTVDQLTLKLNKVGALCYLTEELLADAPALGAIVGQMFADALAFKVESAIVSGTGAGQPLGILNAGCTVSVAKEDSQTATTIAVANIVKMWSRLYAPSRGSAVWFINQDIETQLHQMVLATGTYSGQAVYLPQNGLSAAPYATLYGRPVIPIEHCPTLGTVGDIILADLSQYLLVEKGPVASEQSIHVRFVYDEMALRWTYRVDGAPWWQSALTPHQGSNTQSPFVTLATRS